MEGGGDVVDGAMYIEDNGFVVHRDGEGWGGSRLGVFDQVAGLVVDGDGYTAEWEGCSGVGAEESVLFLAAAASFVDAHFSFRINIEEGRVGIDDGVPYLGDATTIP